MGPLTPDALAALPARFQQWAASRGSAAYRFRRTPSGWVPVVPGELAERVERAIVRVPHELDVAGVEALARDLEYSEFGVILILTPTFAGVSFSHYFGDGPAALGPLRAILSGAPAPDAAPRTTRFPLLRALLATGQWRPSALREGRALLRSMHEHFAVASWSAPGQLTDASTLTLSTFSVDSGLLRARTALERAGAASGSTLSTLDVLTSLIFRAFAASLAPGTDMPIRMLVGLRQHLPEGVSTAGNFSASVILGSLRSRAWSPLEVRNVTGPLTASPTILAAEAVEALVHARARLRPVRAADAGSPLLLTYNVLTGRIGVEKGDFAPGRPPQSTLLMLNRGPLLGPHCTITATGTDFLVTTVDDTGMLDLALFEQTLRAELAP